MLKFLRPLGVFISGQIVLLIIWLFMPALGSAGAELAEKTAGYGSTFWGWAWAVGSVKLIVVLLLELLILYATARAFLATREG